jgi:hypothetical protein
MSSTVALFAPSTMAGCASTSVDTTPSCSAMATERSAPTAGSNMMLA